MSTGYSKDSLLRRIRTIADYQFGTGSGTALFPAGCTFQLSSTGRIRQVRLGEERLATVRAQDGRLTLGIAGAARLAAVLAPPAYRVVVQEDVATFIAAGRTLWQSTSSPPMPASRRGEVLVVMGDDIAPRRQPAQARRCWHLSTV